MGRPRLNIDKAKLILDGLGYKKGGDGIRVPARAMSNEAITPTDLSSANRTFEILQPGFRKIGVQLTQKALDSSAAFDAIIVSYGKYAELRPRPLGMDRL